MFERGEMLCPAQPGDGVETLKRVIDASDQDNAGLDESKSEETWFPAMVKGDETLTDQLGHEANEIEAAGPTSDMEARIECPVEYGWKVSGCKTIDDGTDQELIFEPSNWVKLVWVNPHDQSQSQSAVQIVGLTTVICPLPSLYHGLCTLMCNGYQHPSITTLHLMMTMGNR